MSTLLSRHYVLQLNERTQFTALPFDTVLPFRSRTEILGGVSVCTVLCCYPAGLTDVLTVLSLDIQLRAAEFRCGM